MDDSAARAKFGVLYEQHRRAVLAYCRRRAAEEDAQEIMNETFAIAWRRIDRVPAPEEALPWLFSTARGQLSNQRRGRRRFAKLISKSASLAAMPEPGPESQVVLMQELDEVATAMARLRPIDQELLRLAVWEELSHAEIGQVLSLSENAVSQRLSRATKRLTDEVNKGAVRNPRRRAVWKGDVA